jgi:hypothetical protein
MEVPEHCDWTARRFVGTKGKKVLGFRTAITCTLLSRLCWYEFTRVCWDEIHAFPPVFHAVSLVSL